MMKPSELSLISILNRLQKGACPGKSEMEYLLNLSDPEELRLLFRAARTVRASHFGNRIFLYGFLYFSTYCRNNCRFCNYRQSNGTLPRYRKTETQILTAAREMATAGVHLIDLTMGEDPEFYASGASGFNRLVGLVKGVQETTGLPVMISPGLLPDDVLEEMAAAGVTWYACYQETHNPVLYKRLRHGQGFEQRLAKKRLAKRFGMLIEEGLLTGVGETCGDLADSILWMKDVSVDQARVMTFVPQADTPMAETVPQDDLKELIVIAVMRLVLPDRLIPASLDVGGLDGLKARLDAGANVVTSIVPPQKGLAGVANHSLDIEVSRRTLDHILPVLETCGLAPAPPEAYLAWISGRQTRLIPSREKADIAVC